MIKLYYYHWHPCTPNNNNNNKFYHRCIIIKYFFFTTLYLNQLFISSLDQLLVSSLDKDNKEEMRFIVDTMGDLAFQTDFFCSKTSLTTATGNGLILKAIAIVAGFFLRAIVLSIVKVPLSSSCNSARLMRVQRYKGARVLLTVVIQLNHPTLTTFLCQLLFPTRK